MRVLKKFLKKDKKEIFVSFVFDECLKEYPNKNKMPDEIELRISNINALLVGDGKAIISVSKSTASDKKILRSIFYESFNRIFVKRCFEAVALPRLIEDVIVSRETAKMLGDDYFYYLYLKTSGKPQNFEEYLKNSVAWLAFSGVDETAAEMLHTLAKNKVYEAKAKSLFTIMQKDLWNSVNMDKALKKQRRLDAGSKIQMGELGAVPGA